MYIHSKYSFNAQILSSLEVDPVSLLGDAVVIFQADLHTVHLGDFCLKKGAESNRDPTFFCVGPTRKKPSANVFFYYKRGEHLTQELFFWITKTIFCWKKWVSLSSQRWKERFLFPWGIPWFLPGNEDFFKRLIMGPRGNLSKKSCIFLFMKLSSCFFC